MPIVGNFDPPIAGDQLAPVEREAIQVDHDHGLVLSASDYYDWGGWSEKWLTSAAGDWYFITPSGELYQWHGSGGLTNSTRLTTLTSDYHSNLGLLAEAADRYLTKHPEAAGELLAVQLDGQHSFQSGDDYLNWGGLNEKWIQAADNTWFFITPDGNIHQWHGDEISNHTLLGSVGSEYYDDLSLLQQAHDSYLDLIPAPIVAVLDPALLVGQLGLIESSDYSYDWGGWSEKWIRGADNAWYFIIANGEFYRWNRGAIDNSTLLGTLDSVYYDSPELLFAAADALAADQVFGSIKEEVMV